MDKGTILKTARQKLIMGILIDAMSAGEDISVKELHRRMNYICAYGTVRDSLRHLKKHQLVYYETKGLENFYRPTTKGYAWFAPAAP